jgi:alpha-D-ribose 1-methylphosphonate 5-triphosphate diphosphatase
MSDLTLSGARLLHGDGSIRPGSISVVDSHIAAVSTQPVGSAIDAGKYLVLPGIVDLHGDAFERQLMPRPGVHFPPVPALLETDRQLLANGITTAYHGVTLSWEPGLRGIEAAREFLAALSAARPRLGADTRLHLRFECATLDAVEQIASWIEAGRIDLLAFNDHTDDIASDIERGKLGTYLGRTRLDQASFIALFEQIRARLDAMPAAVARLAEAARKAAIPMASHDDNSPALRRHYRELGCHISEFPINQDTARTAIEAGETVILGGPNVVRGGSHAARLSATETAEAGLCSALTSDYYYPTLLQAAYILAGRGTLPFAECWALVSRNPARAAGLVDRGEITPGRRADVIMVDDSDPALPRVVASYVAGQLRFAAIDLHECQTSQNARR